MFRLNTVPKSERKFYLDAIFTDKSRICIIKDDFQNLLLYVFRRERPGLVASLEQYIMVYDLLQHHLLKGTTIRYKGKPPHPSGVGSARRWAHSVVRCSDGITLD